MQNEKPALKYQHSTAQQFTIQCTIEARKKSAQNYPQ